MFHKFESKFCIIQYVIVFNVLPRSIVNIYILTILQFHNLWTWTWCGSGIFSYLNFLCICHNSHIACICLVIPLTMFWYYLRQYAHWVILKSSILLRNFLITCNQQSCEQLHAWGIPQEKYIENIISLCLKVRHLRNHEAQLSCLRG